MKITREELVAMRVDFLRQFDEYVRDKIGDDEITIDIWFALGVPDGATEIDLIEIAKDDEAWVDCVKCFAKCCKEAEKG